MKSSVWILTDRRSSTKLMERSPGPGQGRVWERHHVLLLAALFTPRKEVWIKSSVLDERIKNVGHSSYPKE